MPAGDMESLSEAIERGVRFHFWPENVDDLLVVNACPGWTVRSLIRKSWHYVFSANGIWPAQHRRALRAIRLATFHAQGRSSLQITLEGCPLSA